MSIADEIEKARKASTDAAAEADRLAQLAALYPDLRRTTGRWGKVGYASAQVNALVTGYEGRYNCGCCADSPFEVWPYLDTPHGRVYSDPSMFFVADQNPYGEGMIGRPGWDQTLRDKGIPEALIERVGYRFPPVSPDPGEPEDAP